MAGFRPTSRGSLPGILVVGCLFAWARAGEEVRGDKEKEQETQVTLQQVPEQVRVAILKQAGDNKITEIEEVTHSEKKIYEAVWVKGGEEVEIKVAPNGKLLAREAEGSKGKTEADDDDGDEKAEAGDDDEKEERKGKQEAESEREVTADQVPESALATIEKQAEKAEITAFAEELEHGHTFYEGSFKKSGGANTDVLVTAAGALVEIKEQTSAEKVPAAVLAAARKAAGKEAKLGFEKRTMIQYEIKFRNDGRSHELLLAPCGSVVSREVAVQRECFRRETRLANVDDMRVLVIEDLQVFRRDGPFQDEVALVPILPPVFVGDNSAEFHWTDNLRKCQNRCPDSPL